MNESEDENSVDNKIYRKVLAALNAKAITTRLKADTINWIVERYSWDHVSPHLEKALLRFRNIEHAEILADVYYCASLEGKRFDCNYIAALLLACGVTSSTSTNGFNLILSICVMMKGVEYQEYYPLSDPEIIAEMERIRNRPQSRIPKSDEARWTP
jgi:hypothetical protein